MFVEIGHHGFRIGAGLQFEDDSQAVALVRFIPDVDELREFAAVDKFADHLLQRTG